MAQLMFETVPSSSLGDSDFFHCGKCKREFLALDKFLSHKTVCKNVAKPCSTMADLNLQSVPGITQNTVLVQKIQMTSSTLGSYPPSLVFTESDLLQFTTAGLEPNSSSPTQVIPQSTYATQTLPVQHFLHQDSHQTVELSILNDKFLTQPIFLASQQPRTIVLNLSGSMEQSSVICSGLEADKDETVEPSDCPVGFGPPDCPEIGETVNCPAVETSDSPVVVETGDCPVVVRTGDCPKVVEATNCPVVEECNEDGGDKEPSTVNIITEFYSSMVKTKKMSVESETVENSDKKDRKMRCAYCSKKFTKNFDLQQHIRSHTGEKPFQCIVCGRAFAQKSNVKKHMHTHKVWPNGLANTLPHLLSKNNSSCSEDGEITNQPSQICAEDPDLPNVQLHNQEAANLGDVDASSYACPYCSFICASYYRYKNHMKKHEAEKVYKCILRSCGQMFSELDPFLDHAKTHENEMTYRCHECNKNFETLFALGSHQLSHSLYPNSVIKNSRSAFQCNLCLNKYSTPAALDHHLATSPHTYTCSWCDKVFPCERYLRRHLHIHSESESFVCNVCNKGFKTDGYLKVHMLVHSKEKPFECHICKAAFNRKDKLKRHNLIHDPVKKYKCPFRNHGGCSKEFSRADKLKSHILTHSSIKPYTCKTCNKNFTRKSRLKQHEKLCHHGRYITDDKSVPVLNISDSNDSELTSDAQQDQKQKKKAPYLNNYCTKSKGRLKKNLSLEDDSFDSNSELVDDVPTAHIEIISVHGMGGSDLGSLSLTPDIGYSDLQLYPVVEETNITESSSMYGEIQSMSSNSLLSSDLQSVADMSDFS